MWSISLNRPFGSLLTRRITLLVSSLVVALFAALTLQASPVHAQLVDDNGYPKATWSGEAIEFEGRRYQELDPAPELAGTICEAHPDRVVYAHFRSQDGRNSIDSSEPIVSAFMICIRNTDRTADIIGNMVEVQADGESVAGPITYSGDSRDERSVTIAAEGSVDTSDTTAVTTCDPEYTQGIGWLICPATNWMARMMDALYGMLEGFLVVSPVTEDRSLYYVWDIMRNLANILFIIGFLIIIYSQATSIGISNYGIKQLLPRLIIAAVLVNISYWIVAVAVDISNILGASIKTLFDSVESQIPASENEFISIRESLTWESVTGFALSGGAAAIGLGSLIVGAALSVGASLYFLIPALIGVIVSALVAILVLAVRQALITILIVVAPLAFVAYLLPSTERYFERWRSLFITMLLVFPAFAVVFGGAKLAGTVIINGALDNPDNKNFFNVIVLGMIVQVAPIIITPLLVKLSGSLIGRIAGIVNDPNKGIIDRSRKWAQERHDLRKFGQISEKRNGRYAHNNPFAQAARWKAVRDKNKEERIKTYQGGVDAAAAQSRDGHSVHAQHEMNTMLKTTGENIAKAEFAQSVARESSLRAQYAQQQNSQEEAEHATEINKSTHEMLRTRPNLETDVATRALYTRAQELNDEKRREAMRQNEIKIVQDDEFHIELGRNTDWQQYAGATEVSDSGATRVQTTAQSKVIAASSERIENYKKRFTYENIHPTTILGKATGALPAVDEEEREAAIEHIAASNDSGNIIRMTEGIDLTNASASIRKTFANAVKSSSAKPVFATMYRLSVDVPQGNVTTHGAELINEWMVDAVNKHKYDANTLASGMTKDEVIRLHKALIDNNKSGLKRLDSIAANQLVADIKRAFKDEQMYRAMGDKLPFLRQLGNDIGMSADDLKPKTP